MPRLFQVQGLQELRTPVEHHQFLATPELVARAVSAETHYDPRSTGLSRAISLCRGWCRKRDDLHVQLVFFRGLPGCCRSTHRVRFLASLK